MLTHIVFMTIDQLDFMLTNIVFVTIDEFDFMLTNFVFLTIDQFDLMLTNIVFVTMLKNHFDLVKKMLKNNFYSVENSHFLTVFHQNSL